MLAMTTLTNHFLIAMPSMRDPSFKRGVAFLCQHSEDGAMGLLVNRLSEYRLGDVLAQMNLSTSSAEIGDSPVLIGGPVQPERGFVLHTTDYKDKATIAIDADLALTADREILEDIGRHKGPKKSLVAFGYAGWAAGQLDAEMGRHDWFIAPADPKLVFDADRSRVWEEAMARRIREL